jgi:hypothetical protein
MHLVPEVGGKPYVYVSRDVCTPTLEVTSTVHEPQIKTLKHTKKHIMHSIKNTITPIDLPS